ncbi:MAG: ABC transporter substrate-binding protein [Chloroflexi bacterium]|nr:ABC transporter substrate-binding protein [Chloroflexota bacterium]
MRLIVQRHLRLVAAFAVLVGLAGCGPVQTATPLSPTATGGVPPQASVPPAGSTPSGPPVTIRLGYVPVMIFAPLFVAQERGYFRDENLNVVMTPVQGGSDSVVQLAAGNFDAAVGGAGAGLLNAANRGVKFTIVAPMHSERPPDTTPLVISAKRAGEFKTVADLKGKKIAINATGAATEYWLSQALAKGGLTINDVQLTSLAFSSVPAALENGSLDASMLGEPLVTINKQNGVIKVLADDFINGFTSTFVYMGDPLLKGKPQAARGFMRAYLRASRDLQGNYMNQEIATIIEKYTKVPASVTLQSALPQYDPNGRIPMADLNTLQTYFLQRGELEYKQPLDLAPFVNTQLAAQVAAELDAQK